MFATITLELERRGVSGITFSQTTQSRHVAT
jgi:hypothetical protein